MISKNINNIKNNKNVRISTLKTQSIGFSDAAEKTRGESQNKYYKIFVGCIPGNATEGEVRQVFSRFLGNIKTLHLERRKNNKCSGYGHLEVDSEESYKSILESKHKYGERNLSVLPFLEKHDLIESQLKFNKRRIVVAQLPQKVTDNDLVKHFKQYGKIEKGFVVKNTKDQDLLPYGHIIFKTEESALKARKNDHYILGKQVYVKTHKIDIRKKLEEIKKSSDSLKNIEGRKSSLEEAFGKFDQNNGSCIGTGEKKSSSKRGRRKKSRKNSSSKRMSRRNSGSSHQLTKNPIEEAEGNFKTYKNKYSYKVCENPEALYKKQRKTPPKYPLKNKNVRTNRANNPVYGNQSNSKINSSNQNRCYLLRKLDSFSSKRPCLQNEKSLDKNILHHELSHISAKVSLQNHYLENLRFNKSVKKFKMNRLRRSPKVGNLRTKYGLIKGDNSSSYSDNSIPSNSSIAEQLKRMSSSKKTWSLF